MTSSFQLALMGPLVKNAKANVTVPMERCAIT